MGTQDLIGIVGSIAIVWFVGKSMVAGIRRGDMWRDNHDEDEWEEERPRHYKRSRVRRYRYYE